MTFRHLAIACVSATALILAAGAYAEPKKGFDIAITIDDLPNHGSLPADMTRVQIGQLTLKALKAHRVPGVYGFVNAVGIQREPGSEQLLKDWRAAGYPLGNHTYTHANINAGTVEAFEAEVEADEPILKELMGNEDWHYLRYPFLAAGDAVHHDQVRAWLKSKGYRVADVSVSFDDWAYTDTYARCVAKGDQAAITGLKTRYMDGVRVAIARSQALSQKVYGRSIPQVLLAHVGGFSAIMLPGVLDALEKSGAHFVTLGQAQSDPAYNQEGPHSGDGTVMERTAYEKGIDISAIAGNSVAGLDQICR